MATYNSKCNHHGHGRTAISEAAKGKSFVALPKELSLSIKWF